MATTPPLDFDHKKGFEIPMKHKDAIRQLYWFGKIPKLQLQARYNLGDTTIDQILAYDTPSRKRPTRVGRPKKLSDAQVDVIIEYLSENYEHHYLDYNHLVLELKLNVTATTLQQRLHQRGYFRCVACQKPYLTAVQVLARFFWAITHIFWTAEWLKVLWSDEVTFLVGGRTVKQRVIRKRGERTCPTYIQH
jgi:transposase